VSKSIQFIETALRESARLTEGLAREAADTIAGIADAIIETCRRGGKILLCGNGGSAADAQHIAAELVVRLTRDRPAVPAIALSTNSSVVTAVANDRAYEWVFHRQVEAFGRPGDLLIALSTSGRSSNVIRAVEKAGEIGLGVVVFTGLGGEELARLAGSAIIVPSRNPQRIQEVHMAVGHVICALVEEEVASWG
jgi:D-sedoheptulose 7-phosphate isomerase